MSSAVLYLAIVALWAVVLVPMWLRRDNDAARPGRSWLPHRRPLTPAEYATAEHPATGATGPSGGTGAAFEEAEGGPAAEEPGAEGPAAAEFVTAEFVTTESHEPGLPGPGLGRRRGRGAVIARRRRRTWGLSLLVFAAVGCAFAGLVPFWSALPPAGLLAGHISLLRVAVGMDAARREAIAQARAAEQAAAAAALAAREAAAQAVQAEIIDLMARNRARGVFDQYAVEGLRVVGD